MKALILMLILGAAAAAQTQQVPCTMPGAVACDSMQFDVMSDARMGCAYTAPAMFYDQAISYSTTYNVYCMANFYPYTIYRTFGQTTAQATGQCKADWGAGGWYLSLCYPYYEGPNYIAATTGTMGTLVTHSFKVNSFTGNCYEAYHTNYGWQCSSVCAGAA